MQPESIQYIEMTIDHYHQVIDVWQQTEHMMLRDADSRESIARYLARNPGLSFVAIIDNKVVGAILVGTDGRRGYVQHLAVLNQYRGQNIGKTLVDKAIHALLAQGIGKSHLFVSVDNHQAERFYGKHGWFERDEVRMYSFNATDTENI